MIHSATQVESARIITKPADPASRVSETRYRIRNLTNKRSIECENGDISRTRSTMWWQQESCCNLLQPNPEKNDNWHTGECNGPFIVTAGSFSRCSFERVAFSKSHFPLRYNGMVLEIPWGRIFVDSVLIHVKYKLLCTVQVHSHAPVPDPRIYPYHTRWSGSGYKSPQTSCTYINGIASPYTRFYGTSSWPRI